MALVSTLLVLLLAVFFVFGKKLWAMFGFSVYLMIIVLGFAAGILAGLGSRAKKTGTGGPRCSSEETIGKNGLEPEHPDHP